MDPGTGMGQAHAAFPLTSWTMVVQSGNRAQLEHLCRLYWKPVYWHVRRRWRASNESAKDLTQAFFTDLIRRGALLEADAERGRFRSFVRASLENFLRSNHRAEQALQRGGGDRVLSIDETDFELPLPAAAETSDPFDEDWSRHLLTEAAMTVIGRLRADDATLAADAFEAFYLSEETPSIAALARQWNASESAVRRGLERGRRALAALVRARVRETLGSVEDLDEEMRLLFQPGGGQ